MTTADWRFQTGAAYSLVSQFLTYSWQVLAPPPHISKSHSRLFLHMYHIVSYKYRLTPDSLWQCWHPWISPTSLTCAHHCMCISFIWTQDALSCIVIRPGMAFQRPGSEDRFLCVSNLRWCIIGWPFCLVTNEDKEEYYLDPCGSASIFFMHKMDDFECSSVEPALQLEEGKIAAHFDVFENSLRCCLRFFSSDLVQHELLFIAELCGNQVSKTKGRAALLELLALQVGDQDFADCVVQADAKCKKKASAGGNGEDDERGLARWSGWDDLGVNGPGRVVWLQRHSAACLHQGQDEEETQMGQPLGEAPASTLPSFLLVTFVFVISMPACPWQHVRATI